MDGWNFGSDEIRAARSCHEEHLKNTPIDVKEDVQRVDVSQEHRSDRLRCQKKKKK